MTDFTGVLDVSDLDHGTVTTVELAGYRIAVAMVSGAPRAFQSLCPHDKASLQGGQVKGCEVHCPRHFARFDLTTGKASAGWRLDDLRLYPARITDGRIEVDAEAVRRNPPEGAKKVWDFS